LTSPTVARDQKDPDRQTADRQTPDRPHRPQDSAPPPYQWSSSLLPSLTPAPDPARESNARTASALASNTEPDKTTNTSPEGAKSTSPATIENEFLRAVSGRKRNLIVDVLNGDARIRRALTQQPDVADIPEQARTRTLERLSKASHAEFPYAQYNLAGKLLRGETVLRDMAAAQKWLTRAAEQGYAPA
jgi:TPR repeat protein